MESEFPANMHIYWYTFVLTTYKVSRNSMQRFKMSCADCSSLQLVAWGIIYSSATKF